MGIMAGELKKCLHKEHNKILKQVKIVDQQMNTKKYSEMLQSKLILEHHLAFGNECVQNSIYPKVFQPCVAYKANDALKENVNKFFTTRPLNY